MLHFLVILFATAVSFVLYFNKCRGNVDPISYAVARLSYKVFPTTFPKNDTTDPPLWRARFKAVSTFSLNPPFETNVADYYHDGMVEGDYRLIRIYNGNYNPSSKKRNVLVYYSGGGFVLGGVEESDTICRLFAKYTDFVIVAVEYSLAPEFPFPRGFDDARAGLRWVYHNIAAYGGDPARIFVAGESAGGTLAVAVTFHNMDGKKTLSKERVRIKGCLLIYPGTSGNTTLPSYETYAHFSGILSTELVKHALALYTGGVPCAQDEYTCLPLYAQPMQLAQLPSMIMVVAENDVLRDDSLHFIDRMRFFGVAVSVHHYPHAIHGFFGRDLFPDGVRALEKASARLLRIAQDVYFEEEDLPDWEDEEAVNRPDRYAYTYKYT